MDQIKQRRERLVGPLGLVGPLHEDRGHMEGMFMGQEVSACHH